MRQPARAIMRWAVIETLVVQVLGGWVSRVIGWPVTYPVTWAVYVLAGREGSRGGPLRYALLAPVEQSRLWRRPFPRLGSR